MAYNTPKTIDIFFQELVRGFEAQNLSARIAKKYKAGAGDLQQSGQTFYRPMPVQTTTVDGLDVSASYKDLLKLTVPSTLTTANLRNSPITFAGTDLNSPQAMKDLVYSTQVQLSNKLDVMVANEIADKGTIVVTNSAPIDNYERVAEAEERMKLEQATKSMRCMLLNPSMARSVAGNLASRETLSGKPLSAYERSSIPPIGGFDTYSVDYAKTIIGSAGSGYLVNGAGQGHTPVEMVGDVPADNTNQTLTVDTGTNAAVGDAFTIDGVFAVGHINKQQCAHLKTFRILAIDGANWTVSPAIIPADGASEAQKAYANVNTSPADNAAITILNTTTRACSVFYEKDAIEIIHSDFNTDHFKATGKSVRKAETDSGIQIVLLGDSGIDDLSVRYRAFIWANVKVLNPELAGILLPDQAGGV